MEYDAMRTVLKVAIQRYYERYNKDWECHNGSCFSDEDSLCFCWNGPTVNLLFWLVLIVWNKYSPQHEVEFSLIDGIVYIRVGRKEKGDTYWLFPLLWKETVDKEFVFTPLICRYYLRWAYVDYARLKSLPVPVSDVPQVDYTPIDYFNLVTYITMRVRSEWERQRMLLTALFLAHPLACRMFFRNYLLMLRGVETISADSFDDKYGLLFLSDVMYDLALSIKEQRRMLDGSYRWEYVGYFKKLLTELGIINELAKKLQGLLNDTCEDLSRFEGLSALCERMDDLLPNAAECRDKEKIWKLKQAKTALQGAKYSLDEVHRINKLNPAKLGFK